MTVNRWCVLAAISLAFGAAGCSNSGSGGGGSSSTAAGSTQTATPGVTSPLPPAPPSQGTGIVAFNDEIQNIWDAMLPGIKALIQQEAQGQLGTIYSNGALSVEVVNVRTLQSQMAPAPGMTQLSPDFLTLRLPRQGSWDLVLEGDVRVQVTITGGIAPHIDIPVRVQVSGLTAEVDVEFDHSDPTRPAVRRVGTPRIGFSVQIDSSSPLLARITPVLTPIADVLAHAALNYALGGLLPTLQSLQGLPGPVPGAGALPLADSGVAVPFEQIMTRIEQKIRRDHLPHGTILGAYMDTPAHDSWEDAFRPGGPGTQGSVVKWASGGDSAIFTGQYLAAQAFRYAVTGDADALGTLNHTLRGIGKLLDVNGGRGLLARCAAPQGSLVAQSFAHTYGSAQINGQTWVGYQGDNGISRDQYSGVFFGLSIAWELVNDTLVRDECQARIEMMLDYLIANKWIVSEDRGNVTTARGPTFWQSSTQKLAFLRMGHRINPTKYEADLAAAGAISETLWLGAWFGVLGNDHYYKFNLAHMAYYNYFRLETDMQRWQDVQRAYLIMRRFVGHHRNPHFDLIASSIDSSKSGVFYPQVREVMRQFLRRNHRQVAPPVVDLSHVVYVPFTQTAYQNGTGSSLTITTTTTLMPSEPLDAELRRPEGHFLWQRTPFNAAIPSQGDDTLEKDGLDAVLPYWMGRYYGAF